MTMHNFIDLHLSSGQWHYTYKILTDWTVCIFIFKNLKMLMETVSTGVIYVLRFVKTHTILHLSLFSKYSALS